MGTRSRGVDVTSYFWLVMMFILFCYCSDSSCIDASATLSSLSRDETYRELLRQEPETAGGAVSERGLSGSGNAGFFLSTTKVIPHGIVTQIVYMGASGPSGQNDLGNNVDFSTGFFAAPVDGYYALSGCALFPNSALGEQRTIWLAIDGQILSKVLAVESSGPKGPTTAQTATNEHVFLTAGQKVSILVYQDSGSGMPVLAFFSGHLVSQN